MLGAQRPTVSTMSSALRRAGLIEHHSGHVTIVDRRRLERASCECYESVHGQLPRLFRPPVATVR